MGLEVQVSEPAMIKSIVILVNTFHLTLKTQIENKIPSKRIGQLQFYFQIFIYLSCFSQIFTGNQYMKLLYQVKCTWCNHFSHLKIYFSTNKHTIFQYCTLLGWVNPLMHLWLWGKKEAVEVKNLLTPAAWLTAVSVIFYLKLPVEVFTTSSYEKLFLKSEPATRTHLQPQCCQCFTLALFSL